MANHLERLAFVDETAIKTNMAKTTGWAPCGQRLVDHAPFGHWRTQTFVAALRKAGVPDGVVASVTVADAAETLRNFPDLGVVAFEGIDAEAVPLRRALAERDGRRVPLASLDDGIERFATERVVSIDTTASGGNASLLTLGDG